jgi:hypothetical protein
MPPTLSPPLKPNTLHASLETHGNGMADAPRSPLSPADCRTLSKILEEVRRASPLATPNFSEEDATSLSIDSVDNESSTTGSEDEVQCTEEQYDYDDEADEADEGYEDEDVSMELNDVVEERLELGDTIEDIMNTPGDTAPRARSQDLTGVYSHHGHVSKETKEINVQRIALEEAVKKECAVQELRDALALAEETIDYYPEQQDDAVNLSASPGFAAVEAVQAETGMSMVPDGTDASIELEVCLVECLQLRHHDILTLYSTLSPTTEERLVSSPLSPQRVAHTSTHAPRIPSSHSQTPSHQSSPLQGADISSSPRMHRY